MKSAKTEMKTVKTEKETVKTEKETVKTEKETVTKSVKKIYGPCEYCNKTFERADGVSQHLKRGNCPILNNFKKSLARKYKNNTDGTRIIIDIVPNGTDGIASLTL
jgi:uncharacterized protein (DUF3084 family)